MRKKSKRKKIKKIGQLVLEQLADIYLYFLGFYIICLLASLFFERWKLFFNWPAFHLSVVFLGILSLFSHQARKFRLIPGKIIKNLIYLFSIKIRALSKKDYLKLGIAVLLLTYSLYKEIDPVNFLILAFGLVSVLFIIESRVAAVFALLFLLSCPILLLLEKQGIAETMAIYAYYFLVIAVATQIREYLKREKAKKVIHS